MAGAVGAASGVSKIKGGRWTVGKFFLLGVAYTIVWMAFCSELGYYRSLYGPSILLQMNIMYFLPSIPLLIASSLLDEPLDRRFGVSKTILQRLMVGLVGCAAIAAVFPFEPSSLRTLLWSVVALGLVHGISFSASYQLVSRFAGKNTISLGLGCVGSGGIVLVVELALRISARPTEAQTLVLYLVCSAFAVAGLMAAVSLLLRHWKSIEATAAPPQPSTARAGGEAEPLRQPLLEQPASHSAGLQDPEAAQPVEPPEVAKPLWTHPSGVLFALSPLDHFQSVSEGETMLDLQQDSSLSIIWPEPNSLRRHKSVEHRRKSLGSGRGSLGSPRPPSLQHATTEPTPMIQALASEQQRHAGQQASPPDSAADVWAEAADDELIGGPEADLAAKDLESEANAGAVLRAIWPTVMGLFFSGTCGLLIFPFLTYVPSDGMLGELLPKTLFFVRLGADLVGRTIPRLKGAAMTSQSGLLALGTLSVASTPLFFVYLKTPARFHNDWLAICFIAYLWILNGAVNSNAYILAPRLVTPRQKSTAAGMLAMIYQVAHVMGLVAGIVVVVYEFGGFDGPTR